MKTLAIITARGGSKGIPRKNIKECGGKPLIAYTIEAALTSRITATIVSTDDQEIASIAKEYDAEVPFMRPAELSQDKTPSLPVIQHAVAEYEKMTGVRYDYVLTLQPTSPLRTAADINTGLDLAAHHNPESVVSLVSLGDFSLGKLKKLDGNLVLPAFENEQEGQRRQDMDTIYRRNGAFYLTRRDILDQDTLYGKETLGFVMPAERSIDINEPIDFEFADFLLRSRHKEA